jgi:HprK-related kinase A
VNLASAPFAIESGVRLTIGPFLVRIRSEHAAIAGHLRLLYGEFPASLEPEAHFDLAILNGRGTRRWLRRQAVLAVNGMRPYKPVPIELAAPVFEWGMNYCIGSRTHQFVTIHSAVVERGGRALILSAASGSGKSTLCAALTYAGWRLFSDEFAILDPGTGEILPAPRPIALKERSMAVIRTRHPDVVYSPEQVDVEGLRFVHARPPADSVRRAQEPARPGAIVFPKYSRGSRTVIERMAKAHALIELAGQSFNYNYLEHGFAALKRLVDESHCYSLEYSDLDDVLPRLAEVI